jgi:IS5 family transposase
VRTGRFEPISRTGGFHISRHEHRHQLSFEYFFLPFGGILSGANRWIKLAELIPWDELEHDYAKKFCKVFGTPAKPFRMALVALIIKACLGLTDEELVEQIKENPYLPFFIGLEAFQYSAPFDPSMMVYFRKRLPEAVVNDYNEKIVHHGLKVIRSSDPQDRGRRVPTVKRRGSRLFHRQELHLPRSAELRHLQRGRGSKWSSDDLLLPPWSLPGSDLY